MPILANAKKALRVSKRKALLNRQTKSKTKTALDKFKKEPTAEGLSGAFSALDRAVKKNLIPKNRAGRLKSQLSKLIAGKASK